MVLCLLAFFDHCEDRLPGEGRVIGFNIKSPQAACSTFMPDTFALKRDECKPMDVQDAN